MSDIDKAFTFLHENTPSWIKDVAAIEEKVFRLQEELAKLPVSRSPLKRRTGSVESIRDVDSPLDENSDPAAAPQIGLHPSRKRKTPSIHSVNAPGIPKYRSRMMVIVTYDGQIQKSFEALVRAIGTGRNMLRKAKMAAKAQEIAALALDEDSDGEDPYDFVNSKIGYRHRTGLSSLRSKGLVADDPGAATPTLAPTEIFDVPDKALESAQALCEKAAHQSLRDGDCRKELDGVRKHFEEIHERAAIEVAKYLAKKKEEDAAKAEAALIAAEAPVEVEPTPVVPNIAPTPAPLVAAASPGGINIEVDDDDEDDMDFVMPPIRLTSRA